MADETTNKLLGDILNRLEAVEQLVNVTAKLVVELEPVVDTSVLLLQAVKELQEAIPADIGERVERLEENDG